jgi:heterodisulfide reductase subunit A
MLRPSDNRPAERIAFIQCVGSRDAKSGHPWCSKICCGSSLRMARLIQSRQQDAQITFFYIDVQTFGKDFPSVYEAARADFTMIRAIPADIYGTDADALKLIYFDPQTRSSAEALFDVVILSVGLLPAAGNAALADAAGFALTESGFMPAGGGRGGMPAGMFAAGAAAGPMSIPESVGSAQNSVFDIVRYFDESESP